MLKVRNLLHALVKENPFHSRVRTLSSTADHKEAKIKVHNWDINYLKVGNGPHNLLCLPGALGSIWTDFKPQIEGLNREKFTLVVWDPPGFGKSRPPEKDFPPYFYERDADYAFEFMKALNIPKYSMLGWSDGGITGMIVAAKYPDVVNKLVIWGCNASILPQEVDLYNKVKNIDSWSKRMREPMIAVYGEELFRKYWEEWTVGVTNLFHARKGDICSRMLQDIKCPTYILYGQKDPMVASVHASHLHTHIVGSKLHLYPDGKHNIHVAYAEDFNKKVEDFLSQPSSKF